MEGGNKSLVFRKKARLFYFGKGEKEKRR